MNIPNSGLIDNRQITILLGFLFAASLSPMHSQTVDGFHPRAQVEVCSIAEQSDGKIIIAGRLDYLGGQRCNNIGRVNGDGSLDAAFRPEAGQAISSVVRSVAVQPDGKILVGGSFGTLAGETRQNIGRLNIDGSLDTTFDPRAGGMVHSLALQSDGRILVGGEFGTLGGKTRNYIGRLNSDGSLDATFNPVAGGVVYSVAVQADGKILVGGTFSMLGGQSRANIGRLNTNGSLDSNFDPEATKPRSPTTSTVRYLRVQPDGKVLVGGSFTTLGGQARNNLGRLNADGSLDTTFNPDVTGIVYTIAQQPDAKILVGGVFVTLGGQARDCIARLNLDGSLDTTFNSSISPRDKDSCVNCISMQTDGKILVGGMFTHLGGVERWSVGRLNVTYPVGVGSLKVTLSPSNAAMNGAQWRVDNGVWQTSDITVSNLSAGSHTVSFKAIGGWTTPADQTVTISANRLKTVSASYVPVTQQTGSLKVNLSPAAAVSAGAQWRVDGGAWHNSGVTVPSLSPGSHTLSFKAISGWATPPSQSASVTADNTTTLNGTYTAGTVFGIYISGNGSISPNLAGQPLQIGKTYTIIATPKGGYIFTGWTGSVVSSNPKLTFVAQADTQLTANFVPNPFVPAKGNYAGLFYEADGVALNSSGYFTAAVTDKGSFSANLSMAGKTYRFSG